MKDKINVLFYLIILLQGIITLYVEGSSFDFLLIFSILIVLSFISKEDWTTGYIYLKDNLLVLLLAVVYVILNKYNVRDVLFNFFVLSIPLLLIELLYQKFINKEEEKFLIGYGDIILISSMCMLLGVMRFLIVLFISSIGVIVVSKIKKQNIVPYGPFLHFGFFISYFLGNNILSLLKLYTRS